MSVSESVSASWNASFTTLTDTVCPVADVAGSTVAVVAVGSVDANCICIASAIVHRTFITRVCRQITKDSRIQLIMFDDWSAWACS